MLSLILWITSITLIWYFVKKYYFEYWTRRSVPGPAPTFFFGNILDNLLLKKSYGDVVADIYNKYPNAPIIGFYKMSTPTLILKDPEVIKEVTVKSFDSFHANDVCIDIKLDPLFGRSPFVLVGEKWKITRSQLTPCFTSGKMKAILPLLDEIGEQLVQFIAKQPDAFNKNGLEAKELCTKLTINNVASCAFGLEGKCFEEENSHFRQLANRFLTPTGWTGFKIFLFFVFPSLSKYIDVKMVPKDVEDELTEIITQAMEYRKKNNIVRNDFLQFMTSLKDTSAEYPFEDIDIVAHCANFFTDGYETSSVVMSFVLYELAANLEVQSKLRDEIRKYLGESGTKISYEKLQEMNYLDAIILESLRITPPGFVINKRCTRSFTYVPKSTSVIKKNVSIEEGTTVVIPFYSLHHDPKHFDEPELFKPERMLPENSKNIPKYAFLPFGEGPRSCLGKRFGLLQLKVDIVHLIRNYEISVNKKTKTPFEFNKLYFLASPVGGIWLDFKKIQQ